MQRETGTRKLGLEWWIQVMSGQELCVKHLLRPVRPQAARDSGMTLGRNSPRHRSSIGNVPNTTACTPQQARARTDGSGLQAGAGRALRWRAGWRPPRPPGRTMDRAAPRRRPSSLRPGQPQRTHRAAATAHVATASSPIPRTPTSQRDYPCLQGRTAIPSLTGWVMPVLVLILPTTPTTLYPTESRC